MGFFLTPLNLHHPENKRELTRTLKNGFPRDKIFVVKPGLSEIAGCRCFPSVRELPVTNTTSAPVAVRFSSQGADRDEYSSSQAGHPYEVAPSS